MSELSLTEEEVNFIRQVLMKTSVNGATPAQQLRIFASLLEKVKVKQDGEV